MRIHLKRGLALLLSLTIALSLLSTAAWATDTATPTEEQPTLMSNSGTIGSLTWNTADDGTLTISGTGAIPDYDYWDDEIIPPWDAAYDDDWDEVPTNSRYFIKKIVIEPGVTRIGNFAFYYCRNLTSITIPDTVTSIGELALYNCDSLTSVVIPDSVTEIEHRAFAYSDVLADVTLPSHLTNAVNCFY